MCVQEEGRLIMELRESAFMATQGKNNNQARQKRKVKVPRQAEIKKESNCFFYKKKGHVKKDYVKFQKWLEKKSKSIPFVCYESNMVDVNHST